MEACVGAPAADAGKVCAFVFQRSKNDYRDAEAIAETVRDQGLGLSLCSRTSLCCLQSGRGGSARGAQVTVI
jgi:hypothetical protein